MSSDAGSRRPATLLRNGRNERQRRAIPTRTELGRVLRSFRERLGVSQERLGFAAKLHRNYVGSAERGERNVSFEGLARWLDALDVSWEEFGTAVDTVVKRKERA